VNVAERFGKNLARYREASGLTQEELAVRASVHRTQVGLLESGQRQPRIETLVKLAGALSIEFANPRHQHEYRALRDNPLPPDIILIPGVIDTTTNFVEHPEVVAKRLEETVAAVGERERVIASTDCGFGTFTNREWVIEPAVWLKLKSLREGADIASERLWGKKSAA